MGKIICFMNNKGGCGKTTTVAAIGEAWAGMGKKILFIDLDSQSNLTSIITDTDSCTQVWDKTIEDAFVGGPEYGLPIISVSENVDIVPTDLGLANFQEATASQQTREWMLSELLDPYRDKYDFILIDCPPALSLISYNALVASDYLTIVSNPDGFSERGVNMVVELYNKVVSNKRLNPNLRMLGIVVTRYQKNNISNHYVQKFRKAFGVDFIEPPIRQCTKLVQAVSLRKSVYEIAPDEKATQEYRQLANEMLQRVVTDK